MSLLPRRISRRRLLAHAALGTGAVLLGCGQPEAEQVAVRPPAATGAPASGGASVPVPASVPATSGSPPPGRSAVALGVGASFGGVRVFPDDNPWNTDISRETVDPNSDNLIASIGLNTGLHPDFGDMDEGTPIGIPYVVVPGSQPKLPVTFEIADESDRGPYPIPPNPPIEGGPNGDGDRHILMIDRDNWLLYELFDAKPGPRPNTWTAGSGAIWSLASNDLRPDGWTSADAAGLPIFPGLVRYDEVFEQQAIRHALRFTAQVTRKAYVHPARHYASEERSANRPPMGMRVRLKASYNITGFSPPVRVILTALKTYGMFLADNGSNWFVSGTHDPRWNSEQMAELKRVKGSDFEVVRLGKLTTG